MFLSMVCYIDLFSKKYSLNEIIVRDAGNCAFYYFSGVETLCLHCLSIFTLTQIHTKKHEIDESMRIRTIHILSYILLFITRVPHFTI